MSLITVGKENSTSIDRQVRGAPRRAAWRAVDARRSHQLGVGELSQVIP